MSIKYLHVESQNYPDNGIEVPELHVLEQTLLPELIYLYYDVP